MSPTYPSPPPTNINTTSITEGGFLFTAINPKGGREWVGEDQAQNQSFVLCLSHFEALLRYEMP